MYACVYKLLVNVLKNSKRLQNGVPVQCINNILNFTIIYFITANPIVVFF